MKSIRSLRRTASAMLIAEAEERCMGSDHIANQIKEHRDVIMDELAERDKKFPNELREYYGTGEKNS